MRFSIEPVLDAFPGYRVGVVVAEDLRVPEASPPAWDARMTAIEAGVRARWGGMELSQIPGVADWRAAYKAFGIKRTSYRSSVERLVKNVLAGRLLPRINGLVDIYNALSAEYVLPAGADDLDEVVGDLCFRPGGPGDSYIRLGDADGAEDPPKPGEIVYADAEKVLCRRWNWSQDARSAVTPATRRAVVTFQSLGAEAPGPAVAALTAAIAAHCAGRSRHWLLDRAAPHAEIG
jgi:DNA/RNA-binding domain of Phe-tRNA-synthetase-like protein